MVDVIDVIEAIDARKMQSPDRSHFPSQGCGGVEDKNRLTQIETSSSVVRVAGASDCMCVSFFGERYSKKNLRDASVRHRSE